MKTVLIKYDISNDLIEWCDRIVDDFEKYMDKMLGWLENDPDGAKYNLISPVKNQVGHWINTYTILEYLNSRCIGQSEEKVRLVKERTKSDYVTEF